MQQANSEESCGRESESGIRRAKLFCLMLLACARLVSAQPDKLFIGATGDIGLGTDTPNEALHIERSGVSTRLLIESDSNNATFRLKASSGRDWVGGLTGVADEFRITRVGSGVTEMIVEATSGDVTIAGTLTTNSSFVPDYVFDKDYPLMALDELSAFIDENGHLPNLPSAAEVERNEGKINMSDLQMKLLEKVEELTLYTLQQERRLLALEKENAALRKELRASPDP